MSDEGEELPPEPYKDRLEATTPAKRDAWQQTLEDMEAIAADRRDQGWDVVTVRASHTDTVTREMSDHDEFGLFHVLPKSDRQQFLDAYDEDEFTEFLFYGAKVEKNLFGVTEFIDEANERSILVANQYDLTRTRGLADAAEQEGYLPTHIKTLDNEILATYRHTEYEPLLGIVD